LAGVSSPRNPVAPLPIARNKKARPPPTLPLAPWPPGIRFLDGPAERILQGQLPARPDNPSRPLLGSAASLTADSALAELSGGDLTAERRARDAERQRRKRAAARVEPRVSKIRFLPLAPAACDPCGHLDAIDAQPKAPPKRGICSSTWEMG
jgi:hypothetical protein